MKRYNIILIILGILLIGSCSEDFLEKYPKGVVTEDILATQQGVNNLLIGAYSKLDGYSQEGWGSIVAGPSQWVMDMIADDQYKGEDPWGWQELNEMERLETQITNSWVENAWISHYDGIARANDVLRVLKEAIANGSIGPADGAVIEAEARLLRAYHHFMAQLKWFQVPYIDEIVEDPSTVANDHAIWPEIEADLTFCIANLPATQAEVGRVTSWTAKTMKARVHIFQNEYSDAKTLLDDVINNGGFTLMDHYFDNFDEDEQNNAESIFEHQYAVNDGSNNSQNGSWDHCVSYSQSSDVGLCCDYQHPSLDLYNAYKVDSVTGLPLLDTYADDFQVHDFGIADADNWVPPRLWLDPRVDWIMGRRGIPFLDYGVNSGSDWANTAHITGGPFIYKKVMFKKSNQYIQSSSTGWAKGVNSNNWRIYRLAHVLLWRAEVAVEENDLATARTLINQVRARAADDFVMGKVTSYSYAPGDTLIIDNNLPADNYLLGQYPAFPDQDYARKAVRMEWRLEAGLEGFRWYDLRRWGIMEQTMSTFITTDNLYRNFLIGATYDARDQYLPIPQDQVDLQTGVLIQDPAY